MAESFELSETLKTNIGWESQPWSYHVTVTGVQAFARGAGYDDHVYYDTDAAKAMGYAGLPAPPTYLGTPSFIPGQSHPVFSSPTGTVPELDTGLDQIMDGETEVEYFEPVLAGDLLTGQNRLVDLVTKQSKVLGVMLFEQYETTFTNQDGKVAAVMRFQFIRY
ncbi:MAG: MaoC family dehydratase N-terminal domain-containing protein [Desulfobacterales bacterium]|nr:MaoC family dehydratase N-terminal domain-containing protein [Desulfobacterales bacterium]